jgi:hypothetical protein
LAFDNTNLAQSVSKQKTVLGNITTTTQVEELRKINFSPTATEGRD